MFDPPNQDLGYKLSLSNLRHFIFKRIFNYLYIPCLGSLGSSELTGAVSRRREMYISCVEEMSWNIHGYIYMQ